MKKLKVTTIVGTRPEIIKLSEVIKKLNKYFNHTLIHTGQNYDFELNEIFFKQLGIRKPDFFLNIASKNPAEAISLAIKNTDFVLRKIKPDAVLIYGDTNSCLSIIAAKKLQIPIFHMEAGNRCFDQRVPEEINRKLVDHLSDINITLSEHARRYLLREGINPETVFKTGSPMTEVISKNMPSINKSKIIDDLNLSKSKYFLVSLHREENIDYDENLRKIRDCLDEIAKKYKMPVIVSTHPRTRNRLKHRKFKPKSELIKFMKPLGFHEYIKLMKHANCTISDSGTIAEESSILKIKAITIRQANERPEAFDYGGLIMSGLEPNDVLSSLNLTINNDIHNEVVGDYDCEDVSSRVIKIIQSYTHYVNRNVWKKT